MNPSQEKSRNVANLFALVMTSATPEIAFMPPVPGNLPFTSTSKLKLRKLAARFDPTLWYTVASLALPNRKKLPANRRRRPVANRPARSKRVSVRAAHAKSGTVAPSSSGITTSATPDRPFAGLGDPEPGGETEVEDQHDGRDRAPSRLSIGRDLRRGGGARYARVTGRSTVIAGSTAGSTRLRLAGGLGPLGEEVVDVDGDLGGVTVRARADCALRPRPVGSGARPRCE